MKSIARWGAERGALSPAAVALAARASASAVGERAILPRSTLLALLALLAAGTAAASQEDMQEPGRYTRALQTWIALPANPGFEDLAAGRILSGTNGWMRDSVGNVFKRTGSGSPRRVIACGLDQVGYAVSEITDDGYLRVHGDGNGRQHALWDQFHEGQRLFVIGHEAGGNRPRYVPGVFAVRSTHLWRRRSADTLPATIEDLWVDVGARSRAEVARLGIRLLDPVFREWPAWGVADYAVGPAAGDRAGCEAVAAAGETGNPKVGETDYVISVQSRFGWVGLTSYLASIVHVDTLIVIDAALANQLGGPGPRREAPWAALSRIDVGTTLALKVRARFAGTLVESVRESDMASLHETVARLAGLDVLPDPVRLARPYSAPPPVVIRDSMTHIADVLGRLTDVYSVSEHEGPMREAITDLLPDWAREKALADSAGNLVLAMGPDRDTAVFVAHMDEVGFTVLRVNRDGTVQLRQRGGFFPFLWEGQTALLHREGDRIPSRTAEGCGAARGGPLRGIFVPRDSARTREPSQLVAWFGVDSAALVVQGVAPGASLTSYKCSARIGALRFTARSIDDRAGDTALLLALDDIDPAKLDHKVIFVWSVREETGLEGAQAIAQQYGTTVERVHPIDTFVSSDSPLESARFAAATLGDGAVARALDNSSVTPPEEVDRLVRIARAARIPLQVGTTNGGNDGSALTRYGAIDVPIGWPLRYSHSPAEVIDLRDIRSLGRIVAAVAKTRVARR